MSEAKHEPRYGCTKCRICYKFAFDLAEHGDDLWCDDCWDGAGMQHATGIDWSDRSSFVPESEQRIADLEAENQRLREALEEIGKAASNKAELHPTLLWIADRAVEAVEAGGD